MCYRAADSGGRVVLVISKSVLFETMARVCPRLPSNAFTTRVHNQRLTSASGERF